MVEVLSSQFIFPAEHGNDVEHDNGPPSRSSFLKRIGSVLLPCAAVLSLALVITGADAGATCMGGAGDAAGLLFAPRIAAQIMLDLGPTTATAALPATAENASSPFSKHTAAAANDLGADAVVLLRQLLSARRYVVKQQCGGVSSCSATAVPTSSDDWDMDDDYTVPDDDTDDKRAGDPLQSVRHAQTGQHDVAVQEMFVFASLGNVTEKVAAENSWSVGHSEAVALEYIRALYVLKDAGPPMVPSRDVDMLWHGHILDTKQYASFCFRALGHFLHHVPSYTTSEKAALRPKYAAFLDHYTKRFGNPPSSVWPLLHEDCDGDGTCGAGVSCQYTCNDNMN